MGRIDEIRERMERATPGPWSIARDCVHDVWAGIQGEFIDMEICCDNEANASFVANCRSDIPFLLAENERLTERCEKLEANIQLMHKLTAEEMARQWIELDKYRDAEKEGRLIVLPCKVGDTVFVIDKWSDEPYIFRTKVKKISSVNSKYIHILCVEQCDVWFDKLASDFGKTVFLIRELAEAALKGSEQHDA